MQLPDPTLAWPIPAAAVELIAEAEQGPGGGAALTAYRCPAGVWTYGWGETDGVHPGMTCTQAEADSMLCTDLTHRAAAVKAMCTIEPSPSELGALCSLAYNIGLRDDKRRTGLFYSQVLKSHNKGDSAAAARAFGLYNKARVNGALVPLAGLTRRRHAEAALYLEDAAGATAPTPQEVEPQSSLATSPNMLLGITSSLTGAAAVAKAASDQVQSISDAVHPVIAQLTSAADWLGVSPQLLAGGIAVAIGLGVMYQRWKQRAGGWA